MNLSSATLKNRAKIKLQGLYGQSVLVTLIYTLCISALSSVGTAVSFFTGGLPMLSEFFSSMENGDFSTAFATENAVNYRFSISPFASIGSLASILVMGPLAVGVAHFFLRVTDRNNPQLGDVFAEFKNFGNTVVLYLLISFFTFLWSLLFIIPGIIAAIRYSMAVYIMAEHPEIKPLDAIKMSKEMMQGHKGEYFVLQLSFIGWWLLCVLTCFIGVIFLSPYISTANAEFFNEISGKNVEKMRAGVDPNGLATFFGGAAAADGAYAQSQGNTGYQQPGQPQGFNAYSQPAQPQGYTGYSQPAQPQGYTGYTQPAQTQDSAGYAPSGFPHYGTDAPQADRSDGENSAQ